MKITSIFRLTSWVPSFCCSGLHNFRVCSGNSSNKVAECRHDGPGMARELSGACVAATIFLVIFQQALTMKTKKKVPDFSQIFRIPRPKQAEVETPDGLARDTR